MHAPSDPAGLSRLLSAAATTPGPDVDLDGAVADIYRELRAIAAAYVRQERLGHTLQATALTHEAYLRLHESTGIAWKSRGHLLALAARAMRRTLVDHARARRTRKRDAAAATLGNTLQVEVDGVGNGRTRLDLLALDRALEELGREDDRRLAIVEMIYFAGLTTAEAAEVLGVSRRTVERDWRFARAWLLAQLT